VSKLTLDQDVSALPGVGPKLKDTFSNIEVHTLLDLITYPPSDLNDHREIIPISELDLHQEAIVIGEVLSVNNTYLRSRKVITKAKIADESGSIDLTWFNQPFQLQALRKIKRGLFHIRNTPKSRYCKSYQAVGGNGVLGKLSPKYPLTKGLTYKSLTKFIKLGLNSIDLKQLTDYPEEILAKYSLINLKSSLKELHFPESEDSFKLSINRLAYEEMLGILFDITKRRAVGSDKQSKALSFNLDTLSEFIQELPFTPTDDQMKSMKKIIDDMQLEKPMQRLLNGDVGSGKTLVAIMAALITVNSGHKVIIMAPTTVLAKQHFEEFKERLGAEMRVGLRIGGDKLTEEHDITIGTHALLYEDNLPTEVGLVIVDEQHRFGVAQREALIKSLNQDYQPHYLSMTATPIPRTLTNVFYGDMSVSQILQKPSNRKAVTSKLVTEDKRDDCYRWLSGNMEQDKELQAYIVFSQIEESENEKRSLLNTYEDLKKSYFSEIKTEILHGKMKDQEKLDIISRFQQGEIQALFSTTVIEVGVNNPNASVILIESPESYGLAQLHQLRGRVGRGAKESECYLLLSDNSATKRLKYFVTTDSGFDLSEYDLQERGPGEIYGTKQSGLPDLRFVDLRDMQLIESAKELTEELAEQGITEPALKLFTGSTHLSD